MPRNFSHLSYENRITIELLRAQGASMRSIASALNVSPSTVSREIDRSGGKAAGVAATPAACLALAALPASLASRR